jgi:hypothetical protein
MRSIRPCGPSGWEAENETSLMHHEAQAEIHGFSFRPRRRISLEANVFGCSRQEAGHKFCAMSRQKCLDPR